MQRNRRKYITWTRREYRLLRERINAQLAHLPVVDRARIIDRLMKRMSK